MVCLLACCYKLQSLWQQSRESSRLCLKTNVLSQVWQFHPKLQLPLCTFWTFFGIWYSCYYLACVIRFSYLICVEVSSVIANFSVWGFKTSWMTPLSPSWNPASVARYTVITWTSSLALAKLVIFWGGVIILLCLLIDICFYCQSEHKTLNAMNLFIFYKMFRPSSGRITITWRKKVMLLWFYLQKSVVKLKECERR